ncbi:MULTISPECIES: Lar family restriction alleviation protein [unclassified Oceanobacter]|uniref:Lar family restriction alleviation protein n=1 Tax=unclassified Oceanobacter TaxID=2620260 RepID=UPI002733DD67|nr:MULTISPECIES: Lar family restriction alleviation protein [unclassified Oceanobacter]MDP2610055.1 Lar family restriction alleviation protein [Oceanobacter sp. 1_MG-2023]MDP2613309.1 Lar family restriction alleviation protein [Oceanobacter sp. 2_MG-2023]
MIGGFGASIDTRTGISRSWYLRNGKQYWTDNDQPCEEKSPENQTMKNLLNCPFCGGTAKLHKGRSSDSASVAVVICENIDCGAKGSARCCDSEKYRKINELPQRAIDAWNTRAIDANVNTGDPEDLAKAKKERDALWRQIMSVRSFIDSDKMACSFQSLGQYRTVVLELLESSKQETGQ